MRIPAAAIVAAFSCGIALALYTAEIPKAPPVSLVSSCLIACFVFILTGFVLTRIGRLFSAAVISLLSWVLLGFLGACVTAQPEPFDHVTSLLEHRHLNQQTPLRWHGHLRDEPAKLPWGYGLEIELSGVELAGALEPLKGGLRASFTPQPDATPLPELHAGDEIAILTEARLPEVFRDEGAFDRRAYLAQQEIDLVATLRASQLIERVSSPHPTMATRLAGLRRLLREEIDKLCAGSPQAASVLRAMLLGDRSFVDRAEATDFQKTGAFHVLVVAGLHVGAIAAVLFWVGKRLRLARVWTMLLTLMLLFGYVAVVEQRPPVLRAAAMTAIVVLGGSFFRRLELLNSAAVAALLLLIARPLALRDSSFQLTFVAIGCIAGLAAPWLEQTVQPYVRGLRGWQDITRDAAQEPHVAQFRIDLRLLGQWMSAHMPERLGKTAGNAVAGGLSVGFRVWELVVVTIALQVGMLPLMARDFHRVALSAPIVNLGAVPLVGILVPLGFLTLIASMTLPAVGKLLAVPLAWLTLLMMQLVQWFAHLPRWSYRIPGPPFWLILSFFVFGVLLASEMRVRHAWQKTIVLAFGFVWVLCALTIAVFPFKPTWSKGKLEVSVLDVGQGDSLFVVSPGGKTLLIDAGGALSGFHGKEQHFGIDPGEEAVSPYLWSRGFQRLDVVALTHAHQDHVGGLTAILENFRVGRLWMGREVSSAALARLEELAKSQKIPIERELRGRSFEWDGVIGQFLWPDVPPEEPAQEAKNDDSLVLRLHYRGRNIMLPGDAERLAEQQILAENKPEALRSDVLKVGHHGGKNSTTQEFLFAVRPSVGIISVGETNSYGHPSRELLERLEAAGVRILRTDRDGAVHVLTDGEQMEITCFVACPERSDAFASAQAKTPNRKQDSEK